MKVDMVSNIGSIETELASIEKLAPTVSEAYSKRLTDRINKLLEKFEVTVTASDVIKEVGVFADRTDVSEETVRLATHLEPRLSEFARWSKISNRPATRSWEFLISRLPVSGLPTPNLPKSVTYHVYWKKTNHRIWTFGRR